MSNNDALRVFFTSLYIFIFFQFLGTLQYSICFWSKYKILHIKLHSRHSTHAHTHTTNNVMYWLVIKINHNMKGKQKTKINLDVAPNYTIKSRIPSGFLQSRLYMILCYHQHYHPWSPITKWLQFNHSARIRSKWPMGPR